jgi:hypothetical protein
LRPCRWLGGQRVRIGDVFDPGDMPRHKLKNLEASGVIGLRPAPSAR